MEEQRKEHESYGMISICKFSSNGSEFFGSDVIHNGGVSITISNGEKVRHLNKDWFHSTKEIIEINMSYNQFVDAITSGMNTSGVPCTIKHRDLNPIPQIDHVEDKKEQFKASMKDTQQEYRKKIDNILEKLDGNIGKRKATEIKHDLNVLKSHISGNTNFVMKCFNEEMEKTVTEAKHSVSNYIDHKVHSLGLEGLRKELNVLIERK